MSNFVAQLVNLTKEYQLGPGIEPVRALRGVSLDIPEGEFLAIMGASGSGKSTLLNLLGALYRATSGQYLLRGRDVAQMNDDALSAIRNTEIGFIFQSFNLIPQYSVLENIEVPLHYRPGTSGMSARDRDRCLELAMQVGLGDRMDHRPYQLSGGQQQRVAIARSLVNDPAIIMADEPTGNLDSRTSEEILSVLENLNREGRTIIMVTHEPDIARRARRQVYMRDGLIAGEGVYPG
jgi:putative ABC transport system ATP-binding protein